MTFSSFFSICMTHCFSSSMKHLSVAFTSVSASWAPRKYSPKSFLWSSQSFGYLKRSHFHFIAQKSTVDFIVQSTVFGLYIWRSACLRSSSLIILSSYSILCPMMTSTSFIYHTISSSFSSIFGLSFTSIS